MVLNLLNLYSLIVALIYKIGDYVGLYIADLQIFYICCLQVEDQIELKLNLTEDLSTDLILYFNPTEDTVPELVPDNQVLISDVPNSTLLLLTTMVLSQTTRINEYYSSTVQDNDESTNPSMWSEATDANDFIYYNISNATIEFSNSTEATTYLPNVTIHNHSAAQDTIDLNYDDLDYNDERFIMSLFPNESTTLVEWNGALSTSTDISWTPTGSTELSTVKQEEITVDDYDETTELYYELTNETDTTVFPLQTTENPIYKKRLRSLCWETMFGQELVKLTVMDLILTILYVMVTDFFRAIFVRYMNNCWCWDLEKKFPQYGDFKVAENILHLVNNQGMVWMGMFFSPGLIVLNVIKLFIIMYLRSWAVLTCNVPHEVLFRASRSNNFYYALLLMMLFLCVLPVGYAIVWIKPSEYCGPFSTCLRIYHIFTKTIKRNLPRSFFNTLEYIASPGIVIPLLLLLILIIYYFISLTTALREANEDLKV